MGLFSTLVKKTFLGFDYIIDTRSSTTIVLGLGRPIVRTSSFTWNIFSHFSALQDIARSSPPKYCLFEHIIIHHLARSAKFYQLRIWFHDWTLIWIVEVYNSFSFYFYGELCVTPLFKLVMNIELYFSHIGFGIVLTSNISVKTPMMPIDNLVWFFVVVSIGLAVNSHALLLLIE